MEQLGYQAESATWRNAYLMGAMELRHGSFRLGRAGTPQLADAMSGEELVDMMGVRFDPDRFQPEATIVWRLTDLGETHLVGVSNHAVHHQPLGSDRPDADVVVELSRADLVRAIDRPERFDDLAGDGRLRVVTGDGEVAKSFLAALDSFETPTLIEPQPSA